MVMCSERPLVIVAVLTVMSMHRAMRLTSATSMATSSSVPFM